MEATRLSQFSKGGGCGCKIAPAALQEILHTGSQPSYERLLVGNESSDDAAVYAIDDERALISTTDFFMPIVDDPFDFGCIAAANAISDVYAMGGQPLMAVAILGWPLEKLGASMAQQVLEGGRSVCAAAGIPMAGGHTIESSDPIFGLAVTGMAPLKNIRRNGGAREGDLLLLTKPLGAGIMATALKRGLLEKAHYPMLIEQMKTLNAAGAVLGTLEGVHAMTDVTGFGLLGHLLEMTGASGLSATLHYGALPRMEGIGQYLQQRTIPDATFRNWNSYSKKVQFDKGVNVMEAFNLLPDPQTNGGLLLAIDPEALEAVNAVLKASGIKEGLSPIGRFEARGEKELYVTA